MFFLLRKVIKYHIFELLFKCICNLCNDPQAVRIGEIEGKLEGLRVLVTGLVKSVETRDSELTQMNKSYFDELQRHVDDTSEELRRTFAG